MITHARRLLGAVLLSLVVLVPNIKPALAADTTKPTVSMVSPTSATVGEQVTFTVDYSDDDSGVDWCALYVEFADQGEMTLEDGVGSKTHTFTGVGVYTVFVHCIDNAGNRANGRNTAVVVTANQSGDTVSPSVGVISPTSAEINVPVLLTTSYSDAGRVTSCRLIADGFNRGEMTLSNGTASLSTSFDEAITYSVYAECTDSSGNLGSGSLRSLTVTEETDTPEETPTATPGLVKISCPVNSATDHPCRSVYFRSSDGKRHAFPNEKIYFTWYTDFSGVTEISAAEMSALTLGKNVTYRPGVRMVKFITDDKVYAIGRAGLLRWVTSEAIATSLYGQDWSKKIDDLSDALAGNYSHGAAISKASDYSPTTTTNSTTSIEDNY